MFFVVVVSAPATSVNKHKGKGPVAATQFHSPAALLAGCDSLEYARSSSHQPIRFLENPRGDAKASWGSCEVGPNRPPWGSSKSTAWKSGCVQGCSTEGKAPSTKHLDPGKLNPALCDFKQVSDLTWGSGPLPAQWCSQTQA